MSWLLNIVYLFAIVLLSPWLLWRRLRTGRYRQGILARLFGNTHFENADHCKVAWFHGVSVGEIHLLDIIIREFAKENPEWKIVVSSTTDTGLAEAKKLFAKQTVIAWPFDFSWAVQKAFTTVKPNLLVLAEGELWPNAIRIANKLGIKVAVVNARMSPRSLARYQKVCRLANALLFNGIHKIGCQTEEYTQRFIDLGIPRDKIVNTGSVKFDGAVQNNIKPTPLLQLGRQEAENDVGRIIWVAGSTHAPEEEIIIKVYQQIIAKHTNLFLILVPRHPDRFEEVARMIGSKQINYSRRSRWKDDIPPANLPSLLLLDTIGELSAAWSIADLGYVGGTLDGKRGGQSMIEPAGFGVPTVYGPHVWNFKEAANQLVQQGGSVMIPQAENLAGEIEKLIANTFERKRMGECARKFILSQQGATGRTVAMLCHLINDVDSQNLRQNAA